LRVTGNRGCPGDIRVTPQDWTVNGADALTLYYRGQADPDRDQLYVQNHLTQDELRVLRRIVQEELK